MKEQIIDTVALATKDVMLTIGHYQDKIATLETVVTVAIVAFAAVSFLAVKWGMTIRNAKKNGIEIK